ncbi:protein of unknown function [Beijerinckiaceae bacterium RH AL1]|nr:protein of unknown function [Beijerinckiaceae bacterium RH AL1]
MNRYHDIKGSPEEALLHFVQYGLEEGRFPSKEEEFKKQWFGVFNPEWYRSHYDDVRAHNVDPWEHFVRHGYGEGRFPNGYAAALYSKFDGAWYQQAYPDVAQSSMLPWDHYVAYGIGEGRLPHPTIAHPALPDTSPEANSERESNDADGALKAADYNGPFNSAWYLARYPDVAAAGADAFAHYINYGRFEGRLPSPESDDESIWGVRFDAEWYKARNPDVEQSGSDPFNHFINCGILEGRAPNPYEEPREAWDKTRFDREWYLARNGDVAATGGDPLEHYLLYGIREHRKAHPHQRSIGAPVRQAEIDLIKDEPLRSKEAVLFVTHSPDGLIKPHVHTYLKSFDRAGVDIVLIVARDASFSDPADACISISKKVYVRENVGFDFSAWAHVFLLLEALRGKSVLYLTNDSMFGPLNHAGFEAMVERIRKSSADLIGLTENSERGRHLQSYFLAIKSRLLQSQAFGDYIDNIVSLRNKNEVVNEYETQISPTFEALGYRTEALFKSHSQINPTLFAWKELIRDGFPFVKVATIRERHAGVDKFGWRELLEGEGYDTSLIEHVLAGYARRTRRAGRTLSVEKFNFRQGALAELHTFLASNDRIRLPNAQHPKVTIVIVMYNEAELSLLCLRSMAAGHFRDVEVIIVDNFSTDDTYLLLKRVDGARIIRNIEDLYFLRAANQAAAKARGSMLLFVNNDTYLAANALRYGVETMESADDIGVVGGMLIHPSGRLQEAGAVIWSNGDCQGFRRGDDPSAAVYGYRRDVDYCSGAYMLVRRDVFEELGRFDQIYAPAYYEEADLCMRVRRHGFRIVYDPRVVVDHYEFASASSDDEPSVLMRRNRAIFIERHASALGRRHLPLGSDMMLARTSDRQRPVVLVIEDLLPFEAYGAGFPRTLKIVQALVRIGFAVQYYSVHQAQFDASQDRAKLPVDVEFIVGADRPPSVVDVLRERIATAAALIVCRPANMKTVKALVADDVGLFAGKPIIYDAEALCAPREVARTEELRKEGISWVPAMDLAEELSLPSDADCVIAVNEAEAQSFRSAGHLNVHVASTALPLQASIADFQHRSTILFVGRLDHDSTPNVQSLRWFVREAWPRVSSTLGSSARLVIAGTLGAKWLETIEDLSIDVLGPVDDLSPLFEQAKIFIAPARFAAGIPLKVLETASRGVPAVISPLLAKQLGWAAGKECLASESADGFADACISLFQDKRLWTNIRQEALDCIADAYTEEAFQAQIARSLTSVGVRGPAPAAKRERPLPQPALSEMPVQRETTVVYLARGAGDDYEASFDRFVGSYARHPAGMDHRLVVLMKGFRSEIDAARERRRFESLGARVLDVDDAGLDIGAYIAAAREIESEYLCFLNTHAEILADNWLSALYEHVRRDDVGVVGATGSLETLESPGVPRTTFPNPHIRSNAFMLKRSLFLDLAGSLTIRDKVDAYIFESGADSFTRRIVGRGLETLVVGKNGRAYQPYDWVRSDTFRLGEQSNLLVADNQTRRYAEGDREEREMLYRFAWGDVARITALTQ